jgi:hypothetical protein
VGIQNAISSNALVLLLQKSLSERMEMATLNTILGLVTVFAVLIIIIVIIDMFRIIPYLQEKKLKRSKSNDSLEVNNTIDDVITQITQQEESEIIKNDYELIAVITAAICASMGDEAPADGLIVRSIRKVNRKK